MLAVIGGSGLPRLPGMQSKRCEEASTPYGAPSAPLEFGTLLGHPVVFLARHGEGHRIAPHEVNYRANLWALHARRVDKVVAIASVGGIRPDLTPGTIVVPDQIIDYTWGRKSTYFEGEAPVKHIDFTEPYSAALRRRILEAAADCGESTCSRAVYATTQGPRLETAAEIDRIEHDGGNIVGMTGMPEAALARELEMSYAAIAVVVNCAAGRGDSRTSISLERIDGVLRESMLRVARIVETLVAQT